MTSAGPASGDEDLEVLIGSELASETTAKCVYRILSRVGEGAMGVAFYAMRIAPEGECGVVVKILRPWFVQQWGKTAELIVQKEAVALGRLNERVPPTPFVVRLIDTGSVDVRCRGVRVRTPWLVVEYVHGGVEGTTLSQRVMHAIRTTGHAFDAQRAANLVDAIGQGLSAVHEVGVIHRDIKPDNVLCCGFGDDEIFKIADFGVARPTGVAATFGGFIVGTLGYAAPELATMDTKAVGSWSDVFSMASVVYFVLTGQEYFDVKSPSDALMAALANTRRSIREAPWLDPALRANAEACKAIDFALAVGTAGKTEVRPQRADALAMMIAPWLRSESPRLSLVNKRRAHLEESDETTQLVAWQWTPLRFPGTFGKVIRDVAWDGDGRCMAATNEGLAFWNGSQWKDVSHEGISDPASIRFVRRVGPGQWLVGGDEATFAMYSSEGPREVRRFADAGLRYELLSGDIDDIAVMIGTANEGPPQLCCLTSRRWLKPLPIEGVAAITRLARIGDAKWLLVGRATDGGGYAAVVRPLEWSLERVETPFVRAFLACFGEPSANSGLAVGASGAVVWVYPNGVRHEFVEGKPDLSAAAIDASGRGWAASAGRIWMHHRTAHATGRVEPPLGQWDVMWQDDSWTAPIVALFTEPGVVVGMTADGGIIEGRTTSSRSPSGFPPPDTSLRKNQGDQAPQTERIPSRR
ncbi:MAG: serine/threonine protein kinase [Polyangiaceae bacterium]|nr:serine/threonine protein kinase [Polyangiaceae bacterium]